MIFGVYINGECQIAVSVVTIHVSVISFCSGNSCFKLSVSVVAMHVSVNQFL